MEISINLVPSMMTYCLSYRLMNWAIFLIGIPIIIDVWLNMDSHIDLDPKVCKDFVRGNGFPRKLIKRIMESDILWSRCDWIYADSFCVEVRTSYDTIKDRFRKKEREKIFRAARTRDLR